MEAEAKGLTWRRAAAGFIDAVLFVAVASVVSVGLYLASNGVVRAPTFQPITRCQPLSTISGEILAAAQAAVGGGPVRPTEAAICKRAFLGVESGRFVSVTLEAQQGDAVVAARIFQPVDRSGHPIAPITFDWLYPLTFVVALSLFEAFAGGTLGKSGMGLKTVGADGGRPAVSRALTRNLIVYAWVFVWLLWPLVMRSLGPMLVGAGATAPLLHAVGRTPAIALMLVPALMLLLGRGAPLYDRWTGVRVVRA